MVTVTMNDNVTLKSCNLRWLGTRGADEDTMASSESNDVSASAAVADLAYVLLNVLLLQGIGFYLKASGTLAQEHQKGLGLFVGVLALPALFFKSLATMNCFDVEPVVLGAAVVGKLTMLVLAQFLGSAMQHFFAPLPGADALRAGIIGLLATNGDELGLGLPAIGAVFPPSYVAMLFVLAGVRALDSQRRQRRAGERRVGFTPT